MLPSLKRTRSAPRNCTRFAAQYPARDIPCERFAAGLATRTSRITRGRGDWLNLTPQRTCTSYPLASLPGARSLGSLTSLPANSRPASAPTAYRSFAIIAPLPIFVLAPARRGLPAFPQPVPTRFPLWLAPCDTICASAIRAPSHDPPYHQTLRRRREHR